MGQVILILILAVFLAAFLFAGFLFFAFFFAMMDSLSMIPLFICLSAAEILINF